MARFRIGAFLLAALLAVSLWGQQRMLSTHRHIAAVMRQAGEWVLVGRWELGESAAGEAMAAWQSARNFTAALADHQPLEDIESLMAQLPVRSTARDRFEYAAACADIARRIDAVAEAHVLSWSSLF